MFLSCQFGYSKLLDTLEVFYKCLKLVSYGKKSYAMEYAVSSCTGPSRHTFFLLADLDPRMLTVVLSPESTGYRLAIIQTVQVEVPNTWRHFGHGSWGGDSHKDHHFESRVSWVQAGCGYILQGMIFRLECLVVVSDDAGGGGVGKHPFPSLQLAGSFFSFWVSPGSHLGVIWPDLSSLL